MEGETKEPIMVCTSEDDEDEIQPAPKRTCDLKRAAQVAVQATFSPLFGDLSADKEESPAQSGWLSNSQSESDNDVEEFQELERLYWLKTSGLKRRRQLEEDGSAERERELEKILGNEQGKKAFENTGLGQYTCTQLKIPL